MTEHFTRYYLKPLEFGEEQTIPSPASGKPRPVTNPLFCSVSPPFLPLQGNAANSSETSMATQPGGSVTSRAASESRSGPPGSSSGSVPIHQNQTATGAKFRHGLLQLMIHTIDPLHDGKSAARALKPLHRAVASIFRLV
ncbi:hypothetical protein pipiens_002566 [Culex pipiens pipiens]|uniref:Uncharacterized protein n=1 Tax=Culex pipiens pipiens TaxID=38569 RepID=A0ABD1DD15_CULPP